MEYTAVIDEIVALEWEMFSRVRNAGGPASCQMAPQTFAAMRKSQFLTWDEPTLESYREDLREAKRQGRNLPTEKYARMMASTHPDEYAAIAPRLPPLDPEAVRLAGEIVAVQVRWKAALNEKYPHLADRGRPLRSADDSPWATSFETYARGELQTYSLETLRRYHALVQRRLREGTSEAEENLLNQARAYGHADLAAAERAAARNINP